MKIRFGALALVAMLAACSSQDPTETGVHTSKGTHASTTSPGNGTALSGYSNDSKRTLGSAPDRGELFGYKKDAAVLHKGAYTLRPIALSEEHAIRGVATGMMTLPGPNGEQIKIRYQRHEESPDGNWSWIGRVVDGDAAREAIITFGENAVFGSIPQVNGPSLQLTTERGIAYLVQADASRLRRGVRAGGDAKVPAAYGASDVHETESLVASATQKIRAQALNVSAEAIPAANTVDLVAGYSNGLATRLGGASVAVTKLTNLVAAANAALANSNVNGKIRLVNALQVSYADNTDNGAALNELTGNNGTGPVTVPASLAPLRAARETYGADLVTLVRDFKSENNGCGIAWLLGANQQPITIAGDAPFAYSVVSEGSYDLSGSTYYCEDITLIHELAHNMGSAHDVGNAGGNSGRYPYSYGYKTTAAQGNFFTVMAYGDNNQTLYRVFSSPLISTCGGLACGVADQADNARSLNQTIPVAATFRSTVVPIIDKAPRDFNGDGKSDVFWRNSINGQNLIWSSGDRALTTLVETVSDQNWKAVASGDFSGDGRADIFWRHSVTGQNILWPNGSGSQLKVLLTIPDLGWKVAGAGDFNGDGKTDLFWHHSTNGQNLIWWAGESAATEARTTTGIAWRVAGIGDFDGDGKDDIFWRNATTGENVIWQSASYANSITQTVISNQAWQIAAVGDFNADGRADAFWKNSATGETILWPSGNYAGSANIAQVAPNWYVASSGDYNGDGRIDLFWYNAVTGASIVWWSASPANAASTEPVFTEWAPAF